MNQHLQKIFDFIQQDEHASIEQKAVLLKSLKDVKQAFAVYEFKLDNTKKEKNTTAILLDKIFQPYFTEKSTAHGSEISHATQGSVFIIKLAQ